MHDPIEQHLESLTPSAHAPESLRERALSAAKSAYRQDQTRRYTVGAGVGVAIAASIFGAILLTPQPASAKTWGMLKAAVDGITSMQVSMTVNDDRQKMEAFFAVSGGKMVAKTSEGHTMVYRDETFTVIDPESTEVIQAKVPAAAMSKLADLKLTDELSFHLSLGKILRDFEDEYGKENMRFSPIRAEGGREIYDVTLTMPDQNNRAKLTVDAMTDLPLAIDVWEGDVMRMSLRARYNDEVSEDAFKFEIPRGKKVVNINEEINKAVGEFTLELDKARAEGRSIFN